MAEPVSADPIEQPQSDPLPPTDKSGWLDGATQRIIALGAVATAIVGLGSQLNACSEQKIQRYAAFRAAVTAEEGFWKDRLDDYAAIAAEEKDLVRKRKERALNALAAHAIPKFSEYDIATIDGGDEVALAQERLRQMKTDLAKAIATSDDPESAGAGQAAVAFDDSQAALAQRAVAETVAPAPANPAAPPKFALNQPTATPNPNTQVLVRGNPKGWDIDVFWCAGGPEATENANYAAARRAAATLAGLSGQGVNIAPSVFLGQVRLRPLPLLRQGGGYPAPGSNMTVRAEADPAEQDAAAAVIGKLGSQGFTLASSETATKWYMSAFVCRANQAPATVAAQPTSGNRATGS
ncbi:MAG: hypothetical protein ABIQ43_08185 [Sphingomonas sp.]